MEDPTAPPLNQDSSTSSPSHTSQADLPSVELPHPQNTYQPTHQSDNPGAEQADHNTAYQQPQIVAPYSHNPDLSYNTQYPAPEQAPPNAGTYAAPPYPAPEQAPPNAGIYAAPPYLQSAPYTFPYPIQHGDPAYIPPKVDSSDPPPPYPGPPDAAGYGSHFVPGNPAFVPGNPAGIPVHSQPPGVNVNQQAPSNVTIVRTVQGDPNGQAINSHLALSIFSIFCCICFGIIATVKSASVNALIAQGRYAEARRVSNQAKTWAMVAIVFGLVNLVTNIIRMTLTGT